MAYEPTTWKSGDVVTSAKLNKLENGVANAAGVLVVGVNGSTRALDKTWQEIYDAVAAGQIVKMPYVNEISAVEYYLGFALINEGQYRVCFFATSSVAGNFETMLCVASSANGYPVISN